MTKVVVDNGGTDWLTPVATLVAVVIGGLVTWWVQWTLARRNEEAQAKASARVLQGDVAISASWLKDMVEDDHRWFGFYDLTFPNWNQHAAVVAQHLEPGDWEVVSQSAIELARLTGAMRLTVGPGGPMEGQHVMGLSPLDLASFRVMWENATKAYNTLGALSEIPPEPGLLHEGEEPPAAIQRHLPTKKT